MGINNLIFKSMIADHRVDRGSVPVGHKYDVAGTAFQTA